MSSPDGIRKPMGGFPYKTGNEFQGWNLGLQDISIAPGVDLQPSERRHPSEHTKAQLYPPP
jgi:hypothetical protein